MTGGWGQGVRLGAALAAVIAAVAAGLVAGLGGPVWLAAGAAAALGALVAPAALDRLRAGRSVAAQSASARALAASNPADAPLPPGVDGALLDQLPTGLILFDADGRVIYQNTVAQELFERRFVRMGYAAALRAPALTEAVSAAFATGRPTDVEVRLLRPKERVAQASIRALPDPARRGGPKVLLTLEDRTRAAKAEALRRDFVANASHELKTPLASISGFIETLQGHARTDPEAAERFLKIMAQQAERMKRLVEDLLSLNRIETNEHVRPTEIIDLAPVVRDVCSALGPIAEAAGSRIDVDLPESGIMIRGSRDELTQVFVNLIDNAIKYAADRGPIRIDRIADGAMRGGMVGLRVSDDGPGIAREHLPRLTERFYRVDVARSRERGGTGLGLAIAKHVVNRHRGDLSVTSVVGEGTRFTAWFPTVAPTPPVDAATAPKP